MPQIMPGPWRWQGIGKAGGKMGIAVCAHVIWVQILLVITDYSAGHRGELSTCPQGRAGIN